MERATHKLYEDISGNSVGIQTYTFGQGQEGVFIQGGIHGGEVTYFIFHALLKFLQTNESKLKKKVTLAPIINPPAWNQRIYYYTMGKFNFYKGNDWNRGYAGDENTLSGKNSQVVYNLSKGYEIGLDMHTARISRPYTIFNDRAMLPLIRTIGLQYNSLADTNNPKQLKMKNMFSDVRARDGKLGATIECGTHDDHNEENNTEVFKAIMRIFKQYGVLDLADNEVETVKNNIYLTEQISVIFTPNSGFVEYLCAPRQEVKAGDKLAIIHHASNLETSEIITAPYDGIIFELAKSHITWVGDELFRIIPQTALEKI